MRNTWLVLTIMAMGAVVASAQPISKSSYETMVATAEQLVANQDYYNALDWYEKAYDEQEEASIIPIIANLNYKLRDYVKAERWLDRLLRRDKNKEYIQERFLYGRVLKMNEKYDDAIVALQDFISLTSDARLKELAQNEITGAEMAQVMPSNPQGVKLENAGRNVNSPTSEYSPVLTPDGSTMYFAALADTKEVTVIDGKNENYHAHIYSAAKSDKGWEKPAELDESINRPGFHSVNSCLSPDGRRMYFNRIEMTGNIPTSSKIYMSEGGNGSWNSANEVQGVNGDYLALHPAVGELFGKEVLFFVSDMPGGHGGLDIYYATYKGDGVYADPINLGPKVNSVGDEYSPYYHDGTLYFSSDGHPGIGGFDIFYSVWDGSSWSEPKNMGKSYNTSVDDIYFRLDPEGYKGVLTSNREGGRSLKSKTCCDDIYTFEIARLFADLVVGVFDDSKKPILGATVSLVEMVNNAPGTPDGKTMDKGNRFDFGLELEKPYKVVATKEGYYPDSTTFNTVGLTASKTFEHRFFLKPKPVPPPEPELDTISVDQPIVLENILYDFDKDVIKPEAEPDLEVVRGLMEQYPDMRIELSSHTDYRGDDAYNQRLSQARAESARRWLVRNGIARDRIEAKGYGETVPQTVNERIASLNPFLKVGDVLTQKFIDALPTEEEREAANYVNRRTEFKIIAGPTTITIKRTSLRKKPETKTQKSRNSLPGTSARQDTVSVSKMSSLYGVKDLKGVPVMQFEKRVIDLGKVKRGEKREFDFEFTNRGDTPLVIAIVTACECTTTDYSKDAVAPGAKGKIHITFDSTEKEESETIDVDIMLDNETPGTGAPIRELVQYKFDLLEK
ncbi:MAG: DUF1573 domain-containing protein [Lewinellaceae bacterium]|nr:DUF1573 domain-containing protein [Lewinellaceae bacterium]